MPNAPEAPHDSGMPTDGSGSAASIGALDLERVDARAQSCAQCAEPIALQYYTLGPHVLCERCQLAFRGMSTPGNAATRVLGATALGSAAAAAGCALWMLVTELTGYEIGLIAIAVGYLVGMAVHVGARRVGGLVYQLLAAFLTYTAIVATYVPLIVHEWTASERFERGSEAAHSEPAAPEASAERAADALDGADAERAVGGGAHEPPVKGALESGAWLWLAALPLAYALPFLAGLENIIGILIIGFALWQAFRMNARRILALEGPFRLEARDPGLG